MSEANKAQIDLWDGRVGERWAAAHVAVEAMLAGAAAALAARVGPVAGQRVLDIGCGAGGTCLAWLAGGAEVTGLDVSGPMLEVAAERTGGKARLLKADAAEWVADAPFDLAVSHFGVMFFADPDRAFAAIAANLEPGGRLVFVCWRAAAENDWVARPMAAIRDLLPPSSPADPTAPGPFALADARRLRALLERAGFTKISIEPVDFPVYFATAGGIEPALALATRIGPTASALVDADPQTLAAALERLRTLLARHDQDGQVALGGAIWLVEACRAG